MGQIYGYMVQVKLPIDLDRMNAAKAWFEVLRKEAGDLIGLASHFDQKREAYENSVPDVMGLLDGDEEGHWEFIDNDQEFGEVVMQWATEARLSEIVECLNLKDTGNDMHWKELEDGTTVIFAGGYTDGDDPTGFGYGCIKDAARFGLFDALGIS